MGHKYSFLRCIYVLFVITIIITFLFFPKNVYSRTIFEDDFETEDYTKWNIYGTPGWSYSDGKFGISLNPGLSNAVPNENSSLEEWKNVALDVDLLGISGTDKNIAFRFYDENNFIEIHHSYGTLYLDKASNRNVTTLSQCSRADCRLENNVNYHFRIITQNDKIIVYLDGLKVFDITDIQLPSLTGKIALRAGTGGVSPTTVWFDNVVVTSLDDVETPTPTPTETPTPTPTETPTPTPTSTPTNTPTLTPTPTPPIPIVFLPGLGASFNYKEMILGIDSPDEWIMTPGASVYDNFLNTFNNYGRFYVFNYDWRQPVITSAQELHDFIQNKVNPWNNKVNLIGHSLGGLVARTCVQTTADNCFAEKLITAGSPHHGSPDSYLALEGDEINRTGIVKLGYELFTHLNQKPGETRRDTLERVAPVLKDLLPNFDYLQKNGVNIPPGSLKFKNDLLPQLQDYSILETITDTIGGEGSLTLESLKLTSPDWLDKILGNWPDGKPIEKINSLQGDESVLVKSAKFDNPNIQNYLFNFSHGGIISEELAIGKILQLLSLTLPISNQPFYEPTNFLIFAVHSPVKISVLNPPENSLNEDELIIIPDPENKIYNLNVLGAGNGIYQLSVGQIYGQNTYWSDYFNTTNSGLTQNYSFFINSQDPKPNPLVDNDGKKNKDLASSLISEIKDEIGKLNIKEYYKKLMLAQIVLIKTDKPEESLIPLGSFRKTVALYEKSNIISSEKAYFFRDRSIYLANYLEILAFLNPKTVRKSVADGMLKLAQKTKSGIKTNKLSKQGALVYQLAEEKLNLALINLPMGDYYKSKIFSFEASSLFLESKNIK